MRCAASISSEDAFRVAVSLSPQPAISEANTHTQPRKIVLIV
jgi:hypothetical protein